MNHFKKILSLALCAAMTLSLGACGDAEADPPKEDQPKEEAVAELSEEEAWKLEPAYGKTVHYLMGEGCTFGPSFADAMGYFEEAGLKAEGVKGTSDVEALGTGAVDISVGHIAKQLVPCTNGVDLTFTGGAHKGCKSIYVMADSPYQTLEDLKGTKVSAPNGVGNSDYNISCRLFDADGINPLKDIELVQVETSACVPAMQNGEISAALMTDTYAYQMVKDGKLRKIRSMLDEDLDQICCVIAMNATFVKENPITAKKMTECVKKAHQYMADHPEEATAKLIELGLNSGDLDMNIECNISYQYNPSDEFTESQLRDIVEDYIKLGLITATDDVEQIMDMAWTPLAPEC